MNRIKLAQGVHLSEFDADKFKRCRISIHFIWPSARSNATAQALLPLLMERGFADCPDMTELSKRLAKLYGASLAVDCGVMGANRILSVSVSGIRDSFALEGEALSAEYAAIAIGTAFRPYLVDGLFDAQAVEIEADQLREQLESEINEKRSYCIRQARRKFFGDAPEGIERYGYVEEVDTLTPQKVTDAFYHILRTAQIEVMVLGADANAVKADLLQALAGVERTPQKIALPQAMPALDAQHFTQAMDTVQGKLCLLFTAQQPFAQQDLSALRVASALLGGTATSRLFLNVREKRSLCYYCAASATARNGMLCIDSGVEHAQAAAAEQAILDEVQALASGEITEKELDETKRSIASALAGVGDTLSGIENWHFTELMRGADNTPNDTLQEVMAVTPADIHRVLGRFTLSVSYLLTKEDADHA